MTIVLRVVLAMALLSAGAGCTGASAGLGGDRVRVENDTTVAVGVYLNDEWVGTYPAGAMAAIGLVGHRGPPFKVSVRTASGFALLEESISAEDMRRAREEGFGWSSATSHPCGTIRLTFGDVEPVDDEASEVEPGPCP